MLAEPRGGPRPLPRTSTNTFDMNDLLFSLHATSVMIDFLMPNGILIQHEVSPSAPLAEIKAEVWEKASEYPLFGLLHDQTSYHFACIQLPAETQELMDESQCLHEINMFINILRVVKRIGNEQEKRLNIQIGQLIEKGLKEFDALKNPEVNDFRWKIRNECDEVVRERNQMSWESQVLYLHPCCLSPTPELPQYILDKMPNRQIYFSVQFTKDQNVESIFTFCLAPETLPSTLLELAFRKRLNTYDSDPTCKTLALEHILKILGHEEHLVSEVPLCQYISIRNHICQGQAQPFQLVVMPKEDIDVEVDPIYGSLMDGGTRPSRASISSSSTLNKKKSLSSWSVEDNLKVKIGTMSKVNVEAEEVSQVSIKAGLYHASTPLCQPLCTAPVSVLAEHAMIQRDLEFPIPVSSLPRNTRLCLAVYELTPSKAKGRVAGAAAGEDFIMKPIAWVNTSVYDYRGHLKGGAMTLYCWSFIEEQVGEFELPNPLGTVVSNPNHERALAVTLTFTKYLGSTTIIYPSKSIILASAQKGGNGEQEETPPLEDQEELKQIADRDPLTELHEQEKKKLWTYRRHCMLNIPHVLSKLLQCVEWDSHVEVAEMLVLLDEYPKLPVDRALELLDYAYAEPAVRNYAVECLSYMSDDDLLLYLLQLVQALKHENYLYCDLVQFLLQRALKNRRIGHFLFWHLRSEMRVPSVSIRFGLILEAYCRGSVEHMRLLQRQVDAFAKFKSLQAVVRENKGVRKRAIASLQESLRDESVGHVLSNFLNPIEPTYRMHSVKVDKCKSMDSKMQPLWLVFGNSDPHGRDIFLLYKKGDDIRQDMLTLQMIRIMDKLWKDHGLDLRLNPYSCLSTDQREGVIEVVTNAQTIANIQREKGIFSATSPFRKRSLLEWLKDNNSTTKGLDNAVHEFTLSCAGYSVATYVLGIADRHNDNIMIMPNGQLFHIDFGHILGHFKEKFGIRRERQPFVLTHDFIYVIQKGTNSKQESFEQFQNCCEKAFMLLRRHGSFIISLFAMMISTGLPELQSEKDLHYLKETLKLNLNDEDARTHFRSKFNEALANAWKTSFNWAFHSISKNNR